MKLICEWRGRNWLEWVMEWLHCIQLPKFKINYETKGANAALSWLINLNWDNRARAKCKINKAKNWMQWNYLMKFILTQPARSLAFFTPANNWFIHHSSIDLLSVHSRRAALFHFNLINSIQCGVSALHFFY